jgi:hypothetical protein
MSDPASPRRTGSLRDPRLDVFRGLALVMIFINHVPGTVYEVLTSRNFGLSDAAEGFVLMSGIAAGLAYGRGMRHGPYWPTVGRIWHRAWTLYLVHLLTVAWAIAIAAATARHFGETRLLFANELGVLFRDPTGFLIGVPLLTHQLGYLNILPLYAVLLLVAPALLWLGQRRPRLLLALSALLWLLTGLREWNLPNFPNPGGWHFNPLAWQLIFVIGLVAGIAARDGRVAYPVWRGGQVTAALILAFGLAWSKVPAVFEGFSVAMSWAGDHGIPRFFWMVEKTYLAWPRLLHMLALAYLLGSLNAVRRVCASPAAVPFALLGRQALPVFAFGSMLCFAGQAIKDVAPPSIMLDSAVILGGLALLLALAALRERLSLR